MTTRSHRASASSREPVVRITVVPALGVEAGGGLVQEQDLGSVDDAEGDVQAAGHVDAGHAGRPMVDREEGGEHPKGRGPPGPVVTEPAVDPARVRGEADPPDRLVGPAGSPGSAKGGGRGDGDSGRPWGSRHQSSRSRASSAMSWASRRVGSSSASRRQLGELRLDPKQARRARRPDQPPPGGPRRWRAGSFRPRKGGAIGRGSTDSIGCAAMDVASPTLAVGRANGRRPR